MDQVQGLNKGVNQNVAELLTNGMREAWKKFMEEFHQVFDMDQLDPVLFFLKQLKSSSQNPTKKQRIQGIGDKTKEEDDSSSEGDNDKDMSSTLEKKVFGNHLLAKSVFKCLPHSDLLSCRRVNSSYWNEYATEILLKRDYAMQFTGRTNSNRFYQTKSWRKDSNWRTLDMLTELLRTSKKFPCNKFGFGIGNLGNDDAQRFFSFYGKFIKSLEIYLSENLFHRNINLSETGFSVSVTNSTTIGRILSEQLPNLEVLHLYLNLSESERMAWGGHNLFLFPPEKNIKLPHLKILHCDSRSSNGFLRHNDDSILRQLLNAATNLKQFGKDDHIVGMDNIDLLIETGKLKCIKILDFFDVEKYYEELEKMADHGLELNSLITYYVSRMYKQPRRWKKTALLLSKIIESSQNSLNNLDFFLSLGFLAQLKLPVIKNVKHLFLDVIRESEFNPEDVHDYSYSFLPRGATFSRNFPQLNSLEIRFGFNISNNDNDDAAAWWTKCFPTDEVVPTVKTLKIHDSESCPDLWIKKLSCMFPNVKSLSALYIKDFSSFSQSIWQYNQKLTELKLEIDMTSPLNSSPHSLDSSFTGIPLEECIQLEKLSLATLEQIGDTFMKNPSILNLRDLIKLDIVFNVYLELSKAQRPLSSFTRLCGTCAFNLLKSLKSVNISVEGFERNEDVKLEIIESLKPLLPYKVNIK